METLELHGYLSGVSDCGNYSVWDGETQEWGMSAKAEGVVPPDRARLDTLSDFQKRQSTKCSDDGGTDDHAEITDRSSGTTEREPRDQVEKEQQQNQC